MDRTVKNAVWLALAIGLTGLAAKSALGEMPVSTNEAVCKLYLPDGGGFTGSGTLVGLSADRKLALIVTAKHIVCHRDTDQLVEPLIDCVFDNVAVKRGVRYHGRVQYVASGKCDAAAIVIHNPGIPPVVIGDFQEQPGIYSACGYGGQPNGDGKYMVARGEAVMTTLEGDIITRTAIWPGYSGGGLFDQYGRWCGITNLTDANGPNGPNLNGITGSQSGEPLRRFMVGATKECRPGFFTRWAQRRGGHSTAAPGECPDGNCGNPSVATTVGSGGGGYANLAPGYSAIGTTGVAAAAPVPSTATIVTTAPAPAPAAVAVAQAPPMLPSAAIATSPRVEAASDPFDPPAPAAAPQVAADSPPVPPRGEVATTETSPVADPIEDLAAGFEAVVNRERKVQATREAVAAWQRAMSGAPAAAEPSTLEERLRAIESRVQSAPVAARSTGCLCGEVCDCKAAAVEVSGDSPGAMMRRIPTVTVEVEYADKKERAIFNLASILQEQLFERAAEAERPQVAN